MPMTIASRSSPGPFLCCRHTCMPFVAVIILWNLACISTSEGLLQDQYIGCFYDKNHMTDVLPASNSTDNALTIEKCILRCHALKTTYAALQNMSVCHCRDVYGVQLGLSDSTCNLNCSGNKNEICGGFIGHQISYSLYTVCPIGTYGAACDEGCHCKHDIPCDRMTGLCPDGCYGNWSGLACNISAIAHHYVGCYNDKEGSRALEHCIYCGLFGRNAINTIQSCSKTCAGKNYSYAGVQYSYECFCGDSYDRYGTSTACNMLCSGDNNTICGGWSANSVYSVCPTGNYGKSCTGRCHCLNNNRCIYRSGLCPSSRCKEGWTGTSCNIRDCTKSNGDCDISEACSTINLKYSTVSVCRCPNGFERTKIWDNCADTDECRLKVCDPNTMICTNTIGSYNCSCRSGFQAHNATTCVDIDECQQNICDNSTTDCSNTHGSYNCSCKQGFWNFNGRNCIGEEHNAGAIRGAVVGSIFVIAAVVAIALLLLFFYRRKNLYSATSENKSRESMSPEPNGDETGHDVSRPCKSNVEDSSRNKPCDKGESADYVNFNVEVHGKLRRSAKDEAALDAASDDNPYESLNSGVSGVDETRIYAELKL